VGVLTKNIPKKFCGELEMQKTSAFSDWRVRNCAVVFESSQFSRSSKRKQQVWRGNTWQLFVHAVEQRLV